MALSSSPAQSLTLGGYITLEINMAGLRLETIARDLSLWLFLVARLFLDFFLIYKNCTF